MGVDRITLVVTISTLGRTKPIPTSPWCRMVKTDRALVTVERAMLSDEKDLGFQLRGKQPTLEETYQEMILAPFMLIVHRVKMEGAYLPTLFFSHPIDITWMVLILSPIDLTWMVLILSPIELTWRMLIFQLCFFHIPGI